jgi:hypothetical protein
MRCSRFTVPQLLLSSAACYSRRLAVSSLSQISQSSFAQALIGSRCISVAQGLWQHTAEIPHEGWDYQMRVAMA